MNKKWKIICLNEVYQFSVGHFLTRCIFYLLILNIENQKFHFLTKICVIRNKRRNAKSFAWLKSTIFFSFWRYLEENTFLNHVNYQKVTEMYTEKKIVKNTFFLISFVIVNIFSKYFMNTLVLMHTLEYNYCFLYSIKSGKNDPFYEFLLIRNFIKLSWAPVSNY